MVCRSTETSSASTARARFGARGAAVDVRTLVLGVCSAAARLGRLVRTVGIGVRTVVIIMRTLRRRVRVGVRTGDGYVRTQSFGVAQDSADR